MGDSEILHIGMVRTRVVGSGNLRLELRSFDDVYVQSIGFHVMTPTAAYKRDRLCNFVQQGTRIKYYTDSIDEYFKINDITVFVKGIYKQLPG